MLMNRSYGFLTVVLNILYKPIFMHFRLTHVFLYIYIRDNSSALALSWYVWKRDIDLLGAENVCNSTLVTNIQLHEFNHNLVCSV